MVLLKFVAFCTSMLDIICNILPHIPSEFHHSQLKSADIDTQPDEAMAYAKHIGHHIGVPVYSYMQLHASYNFLATISYVLRTPECPVDFSWMDLITSKISSQFTTFLMQQLTSYIASYSYRLPCSRIGKSVMKTNDSSQSCAYHISVKMHILICTHMGQ